MDETSLESELLKAVRRAPDRRAGELADLVGLPRTNFGRPFGHRVREPLEHLRSEGLLEEHGGRYRLSDRGRRRLADEALNGSS